MYVHTTYHIGIISLIRRVKIYTYVVSVIV